LCWRNIVPFIIYFVSSVVVRCVSAGWSVLEDRAGVGGQLLTHLVLTVWQPEGLGDSRVAANYMTSTAMWLWCVGDLSVGFHNVCVLLF
jgi:hypothetical protein